MNKKYLMREVAGEYLLVPLAEDEPQFNAVITMNETGAFIWKRLEENLSAYEIAAAMTKEYNVSNEQARADVDEYISYLKEKKII